MDDSAALRDELQKFYRENHQLFLAEEEVLESCGVLFDMGAWTPAKIRPKQWLENFDEVELPYALLMLNRFTFYADHLTDELFQSAFHKISQVNRDRTHSFWEAAGSWDGFCSSVMITIVRGEDPGLADSGYHFARKARQVIGLGDDSLVTEEAALQYLISGSDRPLVFVDDFVGSGNQFLETWERPYELPDGTVTSFDAVWQSGKISQVYYCNAISTTKGLSAIRREYPHVAVLSGNILSPEFSFVDPETKRWNAAVRPLGIRFIKSLRERYGYLPEDESEDDWRGFHKLGLGLSFAHGTPDATLPLFHSEKADWRWLVRVA